MLTLSCCCFAMALTITIMLSAQFFQLADNADKFEPGRLDLGMARYDQCGGIYIGDEEIEKPETGWYQVYRYNAILYLIISIIIGMGCFCVPWAPGLACPSCLFMCTGAPTVTAVILTGVRLFNHRGQLCAQNETIYSVDEELSFANDATMLHKLWLTQLILHVPFGVCAVLGVMSSLFAYENKRRGRFDDSDDDWH